MARQIDLRDVLSANLIVVGNVLNYQIIGDPTNNLISDYAKFVIEPIDTLYGHAPDRIFIKWNNSTFREPKSIPQNKTFIFALRKLKPEEFDMPNSETNVMTLLQAPCSSAYIFDNNGKIGQAIHMIFDSEDSPVLKANTLSESLKLRGGHMRF